MQPEQNSRYKIQGFGAAESIPSGRKEPGQLAYSEDDLERLLRHK